MKTSAVLPSAGAREEADCGTAIFRKTMLYRTGSGPSDWCMNHVLGCSHGCLFPCYAMKMKIRAGQIKDYRDWLKPRLVANTMELLEKEIPKYSGKIGMVHLCFATDPFMYGHPEVAKATLAAMERLNRADMKMSLLTKGIYPTILKDKRRFGAENRYGVTLVSLSPKFREKFEPGAPPYKSRVKALRILHEAGLKTWVNMEPYPTPNIFRQDIGEILRAVSFADQIVFGRWNYNGRADSYPAAGEFYREQAEKVRKFCEERNR